MIIKTCRTCGTVVMTVAIDGEIWLLGQICSCPVLSKFGRATKSKYYEDMSAIVRQDRNVLWFGHY